MPNARFNAMLSRHCETFLDLFIQTSRELFRGREETTKTNLHPGEYGALRELVCRQFLRPLTPAHLSIASGFIVTAGNLTSHQCDVIVYDTTGAPFSSFGELGPFYPRESVVALGEIKSLLPRGKYESAVRQLNEIETIVSNGHDEDPLSFLIFECFNPSEKDSTRNPANDQKWMVATRTAEQQTRVNRMYLSLMDGLLRHDPEELLLPGGRVGHIKAFALTYYARVASRRPTAINLRSYVPEHSNDLRLGWPEGPKAMKRRRGNRHGID